MIFLCFVFSFFYKYWSDLIIESQLIYNYICEYIISEHIKDLCNYISEFKFSFVTYLLQIRISKYKNPSAYLLKIFRGFCYVKSDFTVDESLLLTTG